ncbi:MAG: family 43 glycosylhydrolase [Fusicatenibacter sp.]
MNVLCYTRESQEDIIYSEKLAGSMHLAYEKEDGMFYPLHHNEGIFYAKATQNADGTRKAKCLKSPWLFSVKEGGYGVIALRTGAEGETDPESEGYAVLWVSSDLVHYEELGLVRLEAEGYLMGVRCDRNESGEGYLVSWRRDDGKWMQGWLKNLCAGAVKKTHNIPEPAPAVMEMEKLQKIEGIRPGNQIAVSAQEGLYLCRKLLVPSCRSTELNLPEEGVSIGALSKVTATSAYSDGTSVTRKIDWEPMNGEEVRGRVHQEYFEFPFAVHRADPCCMYWKGKYYFITTNDADGNHSLYVRCSKRLSDIPTAKEDATYSVSLLVPKMGSDLLNPDNWCKNNYPLMSSRSTEGQYGPGHNSYLTDENGMVWNFYHARPGVDASRSSGARRVHFDIDGEPMLDVVEEVDLPSNMRKIRGRLGDETV